MSLPIHYNFFILLFASILIVSLFILMPYFVSYFVNIFCGAKFENVFKKEKHVKMLAFDKAISKLFFFVLNNLNHF